MFGIAFDGRVRRPDAMPECTGGIMKSTRKTASTEIKYGEAGEKVGTLEERSAADAQLVGRWNELARHGNG